MGNILSGHVKIIQINTRNIKSGHVYMSNRFQLLLDSSVRCAFLMGMCMLFTLH